MSQNDPQRTQDILDDLGDEGLSDMKDAIYLQRLEGGLFTLQTVDYILSWVVVEDDGVKRFPLLQLQSADKVIDKDTCTAHA